MLIMTPTNLSSSMHGLLRKNIRKDPFYNLLFLTVLEVFRSLQPCRQGLEPDVSPFSWGQNCSSSVWVPIKNKFSGTAQIHFQWETKIVVQCGFLFWHWISAQLYSSLPLGLGGRVGDWSLQGDRVGPVTWSSATAFVGPSQPNTEAAIEAAGCQYSKRGCWP